MQIVLTYRLQRNISLPASYYEVENAEKLLRELENITITFQISGKSFTTSISADDGFFSLLHKEKTFLFHLNSMF